MKRQEIGIREKGTGLHLVRMTVGQVEVAAGLRDGSTGRVVYVAPQRTRPEKARLERVWAVAEPVPVLAGDPTRDDETVTNGPPGGIGATEPLGELAFYRKYTEALLRRYLRLSMQAGRVPSLMSRDVFRGNCSHYQVRGFEDVVIFCHDVKQRLAKLNPYDQQLIKRVALQRYTRGETAGMLGISLNNCTFQYGRAVDRLTQMFLESGLLDMSRR
jgi:hypothetical protein